MSTIKCYSRRTLPKKFIHSDILKNHDNLCKGKVRKGYTKGQLGKIDFIITCIKKDQDQEFFAGFMLLQLKPDHLYIDVLCAQRCGYPMLKRVIKLARSFKHKFIKLNALPGDALKYWRKNGFVRPNRLGNRIDGYPMTRWLVKRKSTGHKISKIKKKMRRNKDT